MSKGMKKTHWLRTTLIVLVICGLVGTVLAGVRFTQNRASTVAYATLEMTFADAGDGLAPNGNRFNVKEMASDEILLSALEASSLSDKYTTEQIRSSLVVQGSYPEDLQEQFTSYVSVLNSTGGTQLLTISDYHPTAFSVSLNNEFDHAVTREQLTGLLDNILTAYKTYFAASGAYKVELHSTVFNLTDYDYPQLLQILRVRLENLAAYADELNEAHPTFRLNGKGFDDISVRFNNLISGDLSRLEGRISVNALAKDTERLLTQHAYTVRNLTNQLTYQTESLSNLEKLIEGYKKNGTIYVNTSDSLNKIDGNTSATYDNLMARKKALSDSMAATKAKIAEAQQKIADLTGNAALGESAQAGDVSVESAETVTAEVQDATVARDKTLDEATIRELDASIDALVAKQETITQDFDAMVQAKNAEEINELTVSNTAVRYSAPRLLSGAFLKQVLKSAGPFCALGLMVCLALIFLSRYREERAKNSRS